MKRLLSVILCAVMLLSLTGCRLAMQLQAYREIEENEQIKQDILAELEPAERFEITDTDGNVLLTQDDLEKADAMWYSMNSDEEAIPIVQLTFTDGGTKKFADATTMYIGQELPLLLDGEEIMRPTVNERITDGVIIISGDNITYEKAVELAARINSTKE